ESGAQRIAQHRLRPGDPLVEGRQIERLAVRKRRHESGVRRACRHLGASGLGTSHGKHRREGESERQERRLTDHGTPILRTTLREDIAARHYDGTRLSDEMLSRFIISCSVVGLTCNSSAARFCTQPQDCRARMMICRSYSLTTSLNEMPFGGRVGGSRPVDSRWRTEEGSNSSVSSSPVESTTARSMAFSSSRTLPGQ